MSAAPNTCQVHDEVVKRLDERLDDYQRRQDAYVGEVFLRLRAIELKIAWGAGIVAAILFAFQILPYIARIAAWLEKTK